MAHIHKKTLHAEKGSRLRIHVKHEMIIEIDNVHGAHNLPVLMETPGGGAAGVTHCGAYYTCSIPDSGVPVKWKTGDQMYFAFAKKECPCHPKVTIPDGSTWDIVSGTCTSW
jgi:hypothetical protein